ncbi:hypothetical protein GH733_000664, partial [Mirounga leonina]
MAPTKKGGEKKKGCSAINEAQQSCLGQRNKEYSTPYPCVVVQKTYEDEDSQISSIRWLPMCLSPLSKINRQL